MMWRVFLVIGVAGFLALALSSGASGNVAVPDEKIFLDSIDGQQVVDVEGEKLRIRKAEWAPDGRTYMMDGKLYPLDWRAVGEKRKKLQIQERLSIKADALYFDGKIVELPRGVKMRLVWDAVLWNGWVLCLGRTSNTDREANYEPPFFASELVAFSAVEKKALVRYLNFNPPAKTAIKILEGRPQNSAARTLPGLERPAQVDPKPKRSQ